MPFSPGQNPPCCRAIPRPFLLTAVLETGHIHGFWARRPLPSIPADTETIHESNPPTPHRAPSDSSRFPISQARNAADRPPPARFCAQDRLTAFLVGMFSLPLRTPVPPRTRMPSGT